MAGPITTFSDDTVLPAVGQIFPCEGPDCAAGMGSAIFGSLKMPQTLAALALQALGMPAAQAAEIVNSI